MFLQIASFMYSHAEHSSDLVLVEVADTYISIPVDWRYSYVFSFSRLPDTS